MDAGESWIRIALAIEYYQSIGYEYIDVPWFVSQESISHTYTRQNGVIDGDLNKCLVGSAEQSFIHIWDKLESGKKYLSCTPCFRIGDNQDYLHQESFLKVELFVKNASYTDLHYLTSDAERFFRTQSSGVEVSLHEMPFGDFDINVNNIEVGSYLISQRSGKTWACGTGLAEPRFSQALLVKD